MGRVLLILTAACLAATFMIINNSAFRQSTSTTVSNAEPHKKTEKDRSARVEKETRSASATTKRAARRSAGSATDSSPLNAGDPATSLADVKDAVKEEDTDDPLNAIVKGDRTPVYSVNSRDSRVMKVLKKGDRVATDLKVIDSQGKWTIVKETGDQKKPGFVLDENLQTRTARKKTDSRK